MRAFLKKEWMEVTRTGRLGILLLIFVLFGIMNPAIAKLTPWMMELLSDSLAEAGFLITDVNIDAITSWTQFYKNIPMGLVIFALMCSGTFTGEYQKGTLIPVVTKGLPRWKIVAAKAVMLMGMWTVLYLLCFGITYGYNAYFWDNRIARYLLFATACYWLFGIWVTALLVFFSSAVGSNTQVLLGTGAICAGVYLIGRFPKINRYLPVKLTEGMPLLQGVVKPEDYAAAIAVAAGTAAICTALSLWCFDRRQI
ncbi:MAG: ABC transporter permease [Fusicatenibacter sp.]